MVANRIKLWRSVYPNLSNILDALCAANPGSSITLLFNSGENLIKKARHAFLIGDAADGFAEQFIH